MYFNFLPFVKYDVKPIRYPFSESDYVVAVNFFKRYNVTQSAYNSVLFYKKAAISDGQRLDQIAEAVYGNAEYDWVIALVNNMMNPLYDMPMSDKELRKHVESRYQNPYYDIHHYEIISDEEQKEKFGKVLIPGGTVVDKTFYDNEVKLVNDTFPNLTPTSETVRIENKFVFDSRFPDKLIDQSYNTYFGNLNEINDDLGLGPNNDFFIPVLSEDGFRSSTQVILGSGSPDTLQYIVLNPIDTTEYSTINIYHGKKNSPAPGETLQLGYLNSENAIEYIGEIDNWINADGVRNTELTLPEEARGIDTQLIFAVQRDDTGAPDLFAVQSFDLVGTYQKVIPLDFEWNQIDNDNYIIDGVAWTRVAGAGYRKVESGYSYYDNGVVYEIAGDDLARPVTEFEYEEAENEKNREIYLLRPNYLTRFVNDFRKAALYKNSSDFVSNKLKATGV